MSLPADPFSMPVSKVDFSVLENCYDDYWNTLPKLKQPFVWPSILELFRDEPVPQDVWMQPQDLGNDSATQDARTEPQDHAATQDARMEPQDHAAIRDARMEPQDHAGTRDVPMAPLDLGDDSATRDPGNDSDTQDEPANRDAPLPAALLDAVSESLNMLQLQTRCEDESMKSFMEASQKSSLKMKPVAVKKLKEGRVRKAKTSKIIKKPVMPLLKTTLPGPIKSFPEKPDEMLLPLAEKPDETFLPLAEKPDDTLLEKPDDTLLEKPDDMLLKKPDDTLLEKPNETFLPFLKKPDKTFLPLMNKPDKTFLPLVKKETPKKPLVKKETPHRTFLLDKSHVKKPNRTFLSDKSLAKQPNVTFPPLVKKETFEKTSLPDKSLVKIPEKPGKTFLSLEKKEAPPKTLVKKETPSDETRVEKEIWNVPKKWTFKIPKKTPSSKQPLGENPSKMRTPSSFDKTLSPKKLDLVKKPSTEVFKKPIEFETAKQFPEKTKPNFGKFLFQKPKDSPVLKKLKEPKKFKVPLENTLAYKKPKEKLFEKSGKCNAENTVIKSVCKKPNAGKIIDNDFVKHQETVSQRSNEIVLQPEKKCLEEKPCPKKILKKEKHVELYDKNFAEDILIGYVSDEELIEGFDEEMEEGYDNEMKVGIEMFFQTFNKY